MGSVCGWVEVVVLALYLASLGEYFRAAFEMSFRRYGLKCM